jgi:hypothetical protein
MKKAKKAKKLASKPKVVPPPPAGFEYFIDEMPDTSSTEEIQDRCNTLGKDGWEHYQTGPYAFQPTNFRMWFKRQL